MSQKAYRPTAGDYQVGGYFANWLFTSSNLFYHQFITYLFIYLLFSWFRFFRLALFRKYEEKNFYELSTNGKLEIQWEWSFEKSAFIKINLVNLSTENYLFFEPMILNSHPCFLFSFHSKFTRGFPVIRADRIKLNYQPISYAFVFCFPLIVLSWIFKTSFDS